MNRRIAAIRLLGWLLLLFASSAQAFYNPAAGKWLSRDPIGERGGKNLYAFNGNASIYRIDVLGLADYDFRGGWALPPSCSAIAHARMNPKPGLMMPNPSAPSLGNQLHGYPPGTDLSRWFESNQEYTIGRWAQAGMDRVTAAIKAACAGGTNPESLRGSEFVNELIKPAGLSDDVYWWPWATVNDPTVTELPPDDMGRWNAQKALGRYVIRFRNIQISKVYCTCKPCFFWTGELEVSDTPGVTASDDGRRGRFLSAIGVLTDSPDVIIARWRHSGLVCCDSIKGSK